MEKPRASGFVGADTLSFEELAGAAGILLIGEIACRGQVVISVEKFLVVLEGEGPSALVQTQRYSYNAFVRGWHNILRYDNQHPHELYSGHPDPYHKHEFDWRSGEERRDSPKWIGEEGWPTLGGVMILNGGTGEIEVTYPNQIGSQSWELEANRGASLNFNIAAEYTPTLSLAPLPTWRRSGPLERCNSDYRLGRCVLPNLLGFRERRFYSVVQ